MPLAILAAILPVLSELLRFLSSEQGQALIKRGLENEVEARQQLGAVAGWLRKLLSGGIIKFDAAKVFRTDGEKSKAGN